MTPNPFVFKRSTEFFTMQLVSFYVEIFLTSCHYFPALMLLKTKQNKKESQSP